MQTSPLDLARRVVHEIIDDNCFGLAAQLAFYFLLALFPALIFLVAVIGALPVDGVMADWLATLSRVAPPEVLEVIRSQLAAVRAGDQASLLTIGILGAIWSSSAAMQAIITTLNAAYDLQDRRPWWKSRLLAIGLTLALAVFMVIAQGLILLGPWVADLITAQTGVPVSPVWTVLRWVLAGLLIITALDLIYHFAPDAESEFTWITPGSLTAAGLWIAASLGFRFYVVQFSDYAATYGTLGGIIVLMLWFYLSGLAILIGAEVNAEIDLSAEYRDEVHPLRRDAPARIGAAAEREHDAHADEGPDSSASHT
jgi:membrane protein